MHYLPIAVFFSRLQDICLYPLRVSSKPDSEPQDWLRVLALTCKVSSSALPIIDIGSVPSIPRVLERELLQSPHIFTSNYGI